MNREPDARPTPAAVLMSILDVIESPVMIEAVESAGGVNRPDGVRRPGWKLRNQIGHAVPDDGTWMTEVDHAVLHLQSAGSAEELRTALLAMSAITVSWALALEVRIQRGDS